MAILPLIFITFATLFFGFTIFLKMLRYKEEVLLKKKAIENLENLNAELQYDLITRPPKEDPPVKVIKIA